MDMKYLIHELAYGDSKAAMRILYAHFYPKLMSFVYSLVKSKQDTEEIVMSTLYAVWDCQKHDIRLSETEEETDGFI